MKKCLAFFALLIFMTLIIGCETVKGAAEGAKKDWANLGKADAWLRKNLW